MNIETMRVSHPLGNATVVEHFEDLGIPYRNPVNGQYEVRLNPIQAERLKTRKCEMEAVSQTEQKWPRKSGALLSSTALPRVPL